jgi:hypothetical protein
VEQYCTSTKSQVIQTADGAASDATVPNNQTAAEDVIVKLFRLWLPIFSQRISYLQDELHNASCDRF